MNRKYMPYGFDENYEYKTYRNIGKDYGDSRTANAGHIENIKRYFRKKVNKTHFHQNRPLRRFVLHKVFFLCLTTHDRQVYLFTMKKVPRYPVDSSAGGIGTISCHHTD